MLLMEVIGDLIGRLEVRRRGLSGVMGCEVLALGWCEYLCATIDSWSRRISGSLSLPWFS